MSKTLRASVSRKRKTMIKVGWRAGSTMFRNTSQREEVSMIAASYISLGMDCRPANKTRNVKGVHCHTSTKVMETRAQLALDNQGTFQGKKALMSPPSS